MIYTENLTKLYRTGQRTVTAVDHISLEIDDHSYVSIVGKSGSGKSTFLHLLGGLDLPDEGKVVIDGIDLTKLNARGLDDFRRDRIGFVFQFFNLIPELTVRENILFPTMFQKNKNDKSFYGDLINLIGLSGREEHLPCQLSGGEQQRVAIARAVILKPRYLFMDEPCGNLDSESTYVVIDLLDRLYKATDMTIIVVTHDADMANAAPLGVTISDGRLV
ncbi:MAG TPA: ABC transporter ATP-binding protein [Firmicutes bacterium]|nr:ABC transporter ATP-binding protein [Bacillota bacterium]